MTDFFKLKFQVHSLEDDNIPDFLGTVISFVQKWLSDKYRPQVVKQMIPDWALFYTGGLFGSDGSMGSFSAESAGFVSENGWGETWSCRIVENPWQNIKFIPRKWITEIGIMPVSASSVEVSYSVQYYDVVGAKGKSQGLPVLSMPNVLKAIIKSDKWACLIDGRPLTLDLNDYRYFSGKLFGLEECKQLREEQSIKTSAEEGTNEMDSDRKWISLCKVNRPDRNNDIWMQRLADLIDNTLIAPEIDDAKDKIFDNRPLIFCEDGPDMPDTIGFWEWQERKGESGKWLSDATYLSYIEPIEIMVLESATSVVDVVDTLKKGIHVPAYINGNILIVAKSGNAYEGVLCNRSFFNIRPGNEDIASIKSTVYTLPYYKLSVQDVFTWKHRKFYSHANIGEPLNKAQVYDFSETIKQMILQHMTWPIFKAQGISKADWQKFKQFLADITEGSIVEQLSEMYSMPFSEAQDCIDTFLHSVNEYMEVTDFDASLVAQVFSNHTELRRVCTGLAYDQWCSEHQAEIEKAEGEVADIRKNAERDISAAQQQLHEIQTAIASAKTEHNTLLSDISLAQDELNRCSSEIEQYKVLGGETVEAVRRKISEAQKDMASFIADISIFLPNSLSEAPSNPLPHSFGWRYEKPAMGTYADDEIDLSETWDDEFNTIVQNVSSSMGITGDFGGMLSAFLYATHINKIPILVAGPAGRDMAELMATSIYGLGAGHLWLGEGFNGNTAKEIAGYPEKVISVQNLFGKGWWDSLPQSLVSTEQQIVWTHPYVDDISVEPKGLLNYMLPVLSECFVEEIPVLDLWPSKRVAKYKEYIAGKTQPLKINSFKRLKLSKLLLKQLTLALSDAKAIFNQPGKDKDMEILFGLLPLCVITGRTDILKETIETENGISSAVKAEAMRYIEED